MSVLSFVCLLLYFLFFSFVVFFFFFFFFFFQADDGIRFLFFFRGRGGVFESPVGFRSVVSFFFFTFCILAIKSCLLYTSDAADDLTRLDLMVSGDINKKIITKKKIQQTHKQHYRRTAPLNSINDAATTHTHKTQKNNK